jgi:phosphohistidine phosphatase
LGTGTLPWNIPCPTIVCILILVTGSDITAMLCLTGKALHYNIIKKSQCDMKKRLVLIRHAKSSWANPLQSDYERPLNDRGEHDAPMMGRRLKEAGIMPDKIISSTAKRAAQTAKLVAKELGYAEDRIEWHEELYHCVPSVFEEIIHGVDDTVQTLFMVAHNPGISEFAGIIGGYRSNDMPTCAVAGVEMSIEHWNDFSLAQKELFLFDTPKNEHE